MTKTLLNEEGFKIRCQKILGNLGATEDKTTNGGDTKFRDDQVGCRMQDFRGREEERRGEGFENKNEKFSIEPLLYLEPR